MISSFFFQGNSNNVIFEMDESLGDYHDRFTVDKSYWQN